MIRPLSRWLFVLGAILYVFGSADAYWQSRLQVAISGGGGNVFSLIANVAGFDSGGGTITSSAVNSTGGNLIVAEVCQYNQNPIGTLTDSKGNTYTGLTFQSGTFEAYGQIVYKAGPTVGSGHTFTYSNGGQPFGSIAIQVWSGANASPFDVENGSTIGITPGSSLAPGSVTPTNPNSLVVSAICATTGSSGTFSMAGYTISDNTPTVANVEGSAFGWLKETTASPTNPTSSWTGASDAAATIAVFKP